MSRQTTVSAPDNMWKLIEDKPYSVSKIFQMGMKMIGDPEWLERKKILEELKNENSDLRARIYKLEEGITSEQVLMERNSKLNGLYGESKYTIIDLQKNVERLTKLLEEKSKHAD